MGSIDLSEGEVSRRRKKDPRKHNTVKTNMDRKASRDKNVRNSESEDEYYYKKSKKHKSSKDLNEKNNRPLLTNYSDSESSGIEEISQKSRKKQQESKVSKTNRNKEQLNSNSSSSDTERRKKERKRKYTNINEYVDDKRNEVEHKNRLSKLKSKSKSKHESSESNRSPSPKRSKNSDKTESLRGEENKRKRKDEKSKIYQENAFEDSVNKKKKEKYNDRIQSSDNESDFTDRHKERKNKEKNGDEAASRRNKSRRDLNNSDEPEEESHRKRKTSNIDFDKERPLSPRDKYDERTQSQRPMKYQSYWAGGVNVRKNSDNYWNKYPIQDTSDYQSTEKHEVGPRYYGAPRKQTVEQKSKQRDSEVEKDTDEKSEKPESTPAVKPARKSVDLLTSKTGGAYIPPAKLRMMQESITDKGSAAYQRLAWEALKKSIQGLVNKINISNIVPIVKQLQRENIVRGRGLLCRSIIQAQATSPTFTHVYAALVAAINTKFPNIGELLLKRLVVQFRRGFKRNDKTICITAATFIAHLVNHQVAHEILALEILTLLVESPTDDSVEVAIAFLKECGMKLTEVSKKGIAAIFDMLRNILHEGNLDKRVQYMIEVMFQIRKDDFKAYPSIVDGLNLVYEEDQFMHLITLEEQIDTQDILNVFKFDPEYEANEEKYKLLVVEDSDEESSDGSGDSDDEDNSDDDSEENDETGEKNSVIIDKTETNLVALRRTIYLTIQSSLDFEECAHKLLRMQIKPGQEIEMCHMFLDCCAEQRTYEKFYGLLAQRFCQINRTYIGPFEETFKDSYATIHRIETDKLRNIAKLFAHLFFTDAISWEVLSTIRLNEEDTTSSSRIFIKILFLELSEYMGLAKLNQRVKDPSLQTALEGLFPRDNPKNTRFAINFFTSIGLGGLTDELREHLKTQPKPSIAVPQLVEALSSSSDSSSSDSDSSDSSSESSSSDSSSDSDDSTPKKKSKKKKNVPAKQTKKKKDNKTKSKKPRR